VRVQADESVRAQRGWLFTPGVDDAESECGLDSVDSWDYVINNNSTLQDIKADINFLQIQIQTFIRRSVNYVYKY